MRSLLSLMLASILCSSPSFAANRAAKVYGARARQVVDTVLSGDDPMDYGAAPPQGPYLGRFSRVSAVDASLDALLNHGSIAKLTRASDLVPSWDTLGAEVVTRRGNASLTLFLTWLL